MVPLDPSSNMGILHLTTGYQASDAQCQAMEVALIRHAPLYCHNAGLSLDNDNKSSPLLPEWPLQQPEPLLEAQEQHQIVFDLQGPVDEGHGQADVEEEDNVN